jgi:hypothetical protein
MAIRDAKLHIAGLGRAENDESKQRFSKVFELKRTSIALDPNRFQNRQGSFSQETVDKILREGYDKSQDPIVVWKDPATGLNYLLSGHSRYEGAAQLVKGGKGKGLETLPVKEFFGTFEQAQDFALVEANRSGTDEGLKSDVQAYRRAKEQGKDKGYMLSVFKTADRVSTLDALAHLNPIGRFMEILGEPSERSFPFLARNAAWVGQIRRSFPTLTNSHEAELFEYLYSQKKGAFFSTRKEDFFADVDRKVSRFDFDPKKPLNMRNLVSGKKASEHLRDELDAVERDFRDLVEQRLKIESSVAKWVNAEKDSPGSDDKRPSRISRLRDELHLLNGAILRLAEKRDLLLIDIRKAERDTQFDLFNPVVESLAPEPKIVVPDDSERLAFEASVKAKALALLKKLQLKSQVKAGSRPQIALFG